MRNLLKKIDVLWHRKLGFRIGIEKETVEDPMQHGNAFGGVLAIFWFICFGVYFTVNTIDLRWKNGMRTEQI